VKNSGLPACLHNIAVGGLSNGLSPLPALFKCPKFSPAESFSVDHLWFDSSQFIKWFVFTVSCLQNLYIYVPQTLGIHSLMHFVLWGAPEQRVWRDIRSVEVEIWFALSPQASHFLGRSVEHQQRHEKWWKSFSHQGREGGDSQDIHVNGLVQCTSGALYAVQL